MKEGTDSEHKFRFAAFFILVCLFPIIYLISTEVRRKYHTMSDHMSYVQKQAQLGIFEAKIKSFYAFT